MAKMHDLNAAQANAAVEAVVEYLVNVVTDDYTPGDYAEGKRSTAQTALDLITEAIKEHR